MFRTVPLSIIRSFSLYTQQWYMSYWFADSLRTGSQQNIVILLASCEELLLMDRGIVRNMQRFIPRKKFKKLVHLVGFITRNQNAGRTHSMKNDNSSFERVDEFKYLGTNLAHQNSIQEEIKSRLKSGNACYRSVQNLLSSSLLPKNLKVKIYRTIILPVVFYGCET